MFSPSHQPSPASRPKPIQKITIILISFPGFSRIFSQCLPEMNVLLPQPRRYPVHSWPSSDCPVEGFPRADMNVGQLSTGICSVSPKRSSRTHLGLLGTESYHPSKGQPSMKMQIPDPSKQHFHTVQGKLALFLVVDLVSLTGEGLFVPSVVRNE